VGVLIMPSVSIHPPKTPVTKGSNGIAKATTPNVCKMPGPPAPFVPSPLPNIAKSGSSPNGYSKKVKIEGNTVAIRGATFDSVGDMASKGTGGGLISANTHGPAKFISPGSLTVKVEGKSVHLLGEPMLNNCGPSGSPPNTGVTMSGVKQAQLTFDQAKALLCAIFCECKAEAQARKFEIPTDPADFDAPDFGADAPGPGRAMNQACVERKLNQDYKNTNLIPEQSYDMSANPPSPVPGRPSGSRRPDIVRTRGPGPARAPNIDVFEMKFPGDSYGDGQEEAYERIGGGPVTTLDSKECGC
jgi:uncharacterized Zn-binding protein involved in type VI secretion